MILSVIDVEHEGDYTLRCTFSDKTVKDVDLSPILGAPAFRELKNPDQFIQFGLDQTIFWANGADIAPEWLYEHGIPVE